jgi:threonine dehydrogenase-like Zn-dependent dehydrogenase
MKALVKVSKDTEEVELREVPTPKPGPGEILVQMKATGICYTDISIMKNKYVGRKPVPIPMTLGHEGAGIVAETGPGVTMLTKGDRIVLEVILGCGKCYNCLNGYKNMCADWTHIGITRDGTFAEYIVVPEVMARKLPDNVSFADAALLEPIALTVRSLEAVQPMVGDTAVIIGPGSIGLIHLQALKAAGCSKVILVGIDKDAHRFEIGKKLGADHIVNVSSENAAEAVMNYTNGLGADIVIETANHPVVWSQFSDFVAVHGRISAFGLYPEAQIKPIGLVRKAAVIYGDVATLTRHFVRAIRWVESKKVLAEPLITQRFKLTTQHKEGLEAFFAGNTVKVLFEL